VAIESRGGSLVGLTVEMDLPEMGALGTAIVTDIQPCPRVRAGAGHVITATFKHPPATQVLNVRFEGETEPIGVTDNHPFWSEDRQRFVAIGKLEIGERVRTYQGETKRIETKLPRPGPKTVYNLEVQGPHTYHIGTQGLLVHNSYARGNQRSKRNPNALTFVSENLGVPRNRAQAIARDYESGATGAFSDILSRKRVVPALKFNNPNPRGAAFVKFDGFQQLDGGVMELIDRKTRVVPFSTHQGPFISPSVRDGLTRKSLAISQNPGYRAVLEFPTAAARREAQQVLRQLGITNISTRISNL
jgi:hypothetical protein